MKTETIEEETIITKIDFTYDPAGRRISKQVSSYEDGIWEKSYEYRYIYAGGGLNPIALADTTGKIMETYVYAEKGNVPSYIVRPDGSRYSLITDYLGSVRAVQNMATGEIVQQLEYDEFGVIQRDTLPGFQPFGFAGGLYDDETGLVRFGARDYDAPTGRWLERARLTFDPQTEYTYAAGDPVNLVNPIGRPGEERRAGYYYRLTRYDIVDYYRGPSSGDIIDDTVLGVLGAMRNIAAYTINLGMTVLSADQIIAEAAFGMDENELMSVYITAMQSPDPCVGDNILGGLGYGKTQIAHAVQQADGIIPAIKGLAGKYGLDGIFSKLEYAGTLLMTRVRMVTGTAVRWVPGQPIWEPPAKWNTMKERFWKAIASLNPEWLPANYIRVIKDEGNAPLLKTFVAGKWEVKPAELHHLFPKGLWPPTGMNRIDFRAYFEGAGINLEEFLLVLDKGRHSKIHSNEFTGKQWMQEWYEFAKDNPRPEKEDLFIQLKEMMEKFDLVEKDAGITSLDELKEYGKSFNEIIIKSSRDL